MNDKEITVIRINYNDIEKHMREHCNPSCEWDAEFYYGNQTLFTPAKLDNHNLKEIEKLKSGGVAMFNPHTAIAWLRNEGHLKKTKTYLVDNPDY